VVRAFKATIGPNGIADLHALVIRPERDDKAHDVGRFDM